MSGQLHKLQRRVDVQKVRLTAIDRDLRQDDEEEAWVVQQAVAEEGGAVADDACKPAFLQAANNLRSYSLFSARIGCLLPSGGVGIFEGTVDSKQGQV